MAWKSLAQLFKRIVHWISKTIMKISSTEADPLVIDLELSPPLVYLDHSVISDHAGKPLVISFEMRFSPRTALSTGLGL